MSATNVKGKQVLLRRSAVALFEAFGDLSSFTATLPEEYKDKVRVTRDSVSSEAAGTHIGVRISERTPYSRIVLSSDEATPIKFDIIFHLEQVDFSSSLLQLEINAELNMMLKMMIGNKLQEAVDKITEQIEKSVNEGVVPEKMSDIKFS